MSTVYRRAGRLLIGTLVLYGLLVATHRGEFWPFSIYPMFSQAGQPWSRVIVHEVPQAWTPAWDTVSLDKLHGKPFALKQVGQGNKDISEYVARTKDWTPERISGLRALLSPASSQRNLLVIQARGRLSERDSLIVEHVPLLLLKPDTSFVHPRLSSPS